MRQVLQAAALGVALWLSGAVFAPASPDGSAWIVALPPWPALAAGLAAAGLLVAWRPPRHPLALLPLVAVLWPWLPGIDAGLVYAGPLIVLVWAAVLALGWGDLISTPISACGCATSPARATVAAMLIALASTALVAWRVAPMRPGGDEPHYLIMTQSLMQDGDLRIENNHTQRDYAAYTDVEIDPQYLTRGQDNAIYPIHAPGLPALVIPAFALGGYPGVVLFLLVVMAAASALVWRLAWLATGEIGAAWFGWAVVASSCMWVFQSFLVFPEALGAGAVATGLWLVLRLDRDRQPGLAAIAFTGAALALLPWLHTRFAVLAAGLGVMILLRLRHAGVRPIAVFLATPIAAALGWFGFFYVIYGTPSPLAPWGGAGASSAAWVPTGLAGALFDQQFGILPYAPALVAGFAGLVSGTTDGWRRSTRLQVLLLLVLPYLLATVSYAMWWGGMSVPGRLLTALLPLLAPAAAVVWRRHAGPAVRVALAATVAWGVFATASLALVDHGALAWNVRQHKAGLWFEWLVPSFAWTQSLPAFFRAPDTLGRESLPLAPFYWATAVWLILPAIAVVVAVLIARRMRSGATPAPVVTASLVITALVCAVPAATVLSLRAQGADAVAASRAQVTLLGRLSSGEALIVDLERRRLAPGGALTGGFHMQSTAGESRLVAGPVPEGTYRVSASAGGPIDVRVGRSPVPVQRANGGAIDVRLPVGVQALDVRAPAGQQVTIEPLAVVAAASRGHAVLAAQYGPVAAYFTDSRVYVERDGFWVRGARYADVIVQGAPGHAVTFDIRNGPVENHLAVSGADAPLAAALTPGQVVPVGVTLDAHGVARLRITSDTGFVPAEVEPGNRDRRHLGVYVRVR